MSYLTVNNLTHTYGEGTPSRKVAINDISFSLEKGDVLGVIGHTGSGKSTLVTHLNGLMKPTSGSIILDGKDIWEKPKEIKNIRSKVGLVFQYPEYQLFEETVYKDIAFGPENLGLVGTELDRSVRSAAALMKVQDELLDKSPFELSGGEKRRVAIAGVLAMNPDVVVFDEPTAGLDPIGRETIFSAIADYRKKNNATIIIVSHSMEDIAAVCNKVLVLNGGKVAYFGDTRTVFSNVSGLAEIGLGVPMITSLFEKIKAKHPDLDCSPLTVDEALSFLLSYLGKGGRADA